MDIETRMNLVKQVGEEIITEQDLKKLLEEKKKPIAYDGFEPSGHLHIAQGIMRAINVNKMTKSGCHFKMWVADWFGWANNKIGGDLDKIQTVGKYQIEVWKACGMDMDNVEFLWTSDSVKGDDYWKIVMQVARNTTVKRLLRCSQIMGRTESDAQQGSQILYPMMQCADIFYLKADICQLGMDQRKVNMLAREVGPSFGFWKPVVVSHHMLMGLGKPPPGSKDAAERAIDMKMSKSRPDTAIFMTDSEEDIKRKISKAYCQEKEAYENPVLEYCRYLVFERFNEFKIERPVKFGGDVSFKSYAELENAFVKGEVHPMDLKQSTAVYIDRMIRPVREHFEKNRKAKELLDQVKSFEVTR
ncbi:MAG: tyrosine--tRNA ligase [Candidatus Woesearchaeota archaeon]|nr:tyrosine--tRNA ligase [Candidatus Woesearchaeota archaeon]